LLPLSSDPLNNPRKTLSSLRTRDSRRLGIHQTLAYFDNIWVRPPLVHYYPGCSEKLDAPLLSSIIPECPAATSPPSPTGPPLPSGRRRPDTLLFSLRFGRPSRWCSDLREPGFRRPTPPGPSRSARQIRPAAGGDRRAAAVCALRGAEDLALSGPGGAPGMELVPHRRAPGAALPLHRRLRALRVRGSRSQPHSGSSSTTSAPPRPVGLGDLPRGSRRDRSRLRQQAGAPLAPALRSHRPLAARACAAGVPASCSRPPSPSPRPAASTASSPGTRCAGRTPTSRRAPSPPISRTTRSSTSRRRCARSLRPTTWRRSAPPTR
jgi:hypothetical protein